MRVLLEVCVDSFASAVAARDGGADRLEVCGPLASGGTTPSQGFIEHCVEASGLPVMVMVRPHDGDFVYDKDDLSIMRRDIEFAKAIGAEGVVFGALLQDGSVDQEACQRLLESADELQTTFHRAFDLVQQPLVAFELIERLGFSRVLTSGRQPKAVDGAPLIRQLVQRSTTTGVLAGAGVDASNVQALVAATGVKEVHASASRPFISETRRTAVSFGEQRSVTDLSLVRSIRSALSGDTG